MALQQLRALLCSFVSLRFMPIPHEQLGSFLYSSKPSASLLSTISPPFEFHSKDRHILLQMILSVFLLPPSVALTPNKLPKHHFLWQTLLPYTCYESRKQSPPFARLSFATGGALTAVLGLLRYPTGRPSGASFLQVVAALLDSPPPPVDFFGVAAIGDCPGAAGVGSGER